MNQGQSKAKLCEIIRRLCYKEGRFTLTSGKESTFYVDLKNATLHPEGAALVGELTWALLRPSAFGGVGGPTLGADPLGTALSLAAYRAGVHLPAFIIRKEPKKHGTSQWIEGRENLRSGSELLVVEDVVTTGGSSLKAIARAREEGFEVTRLVAVMDRLEGARQKLAAEGVELVALTTIDEVRAVRL